MNTESMAGPSFQTGHVGINVADLARSINFYRAVFGFEVLRKSEDEGRRFAFLGANSRTILTLWEQSAGRFATDAPGLHHLSFEVESMEAVERVEATLREQNVSLFYEGIVAHSEGAKSGGLFFEDPDGIRLEVYSPTGASDHVAPVSGGPSCGFF